MVIIIIIFKIYIYSIKVSKCNLSLTCQQGLDSASKVRSLRLISPGSIPVASRLLLVGCCVRDLWGTQVRALAGTSVVFVGPVSHMVYTNPGGIIQP